MRNQALQRLPRAEQNRLLKVATAHRLPVGDLQCYMTRQKGSGQGVSRRGREFDISYDLMLCEYCGNLEPSSVCPAKVHKIRVIVTEALIRDFTKRLLEYDLDAPAIAQIATGFRDLVDNGVAERDALAIACALEVKMPTLSMPESRPVRGLLTA